jgi:hypothetical protein
MMKSRTLGTAFIMAFIVVGAAAQATPPSPGPCATRAILGSTQLPQAVLANGERLAAGTYQVSLTGERPTLAVGQSPEGACWIEFLQDGTRAGREVATVISNGEIDQVVKAAKPKPDGSRVDVLKGGDYVRVWIHRGGVHYIINMPPAR